MDNNSFFIPPLRIRNPVKLSNVYEIRRELNNGHLSYITQNSNLHNEFGTNTDTQCSSSVGVEFENDTFQKLLVNQTTNVVDVDINIERVEKTGVKSREPIVNSHIKPENSCKYQKERQKKKNYFIKRYPSLLANRSREGIMISISSQTPSWNLELELVVNYSIGKTLPAIESKNTQVSSEICGNMESEVVRQMDSVIQTNATLKLIDEHDGKETTMDNQIVTFSIAQQSSVHPDQDLIIVEDDNSLTYASEDQSRSKQEMREDDVEDEKNYTTSDDQLHYVDEVIQNYSESLFISSPQIKSHLTNNGELAQNVEQSLSHLAEESSLFVGITLQDKTLVINDDTQQLLHGNEIVSIGMENENGLEISEEKKEHVNRDNSEDRNLRILHSKDNAITISEKYEEVTDLSIVNNPMTAMTQESVTDKVKPDQRSVEQETDNHFDYLNVRGTSTMDNVTVKDYNMQTKLSAVKEEQNAKGVEIKTDLHYEVEMDNFQSGEIFLQDHNRSQQMLEDNDRMPDGVLFIDNSKMDTKKLTFSPEEFRSEPNSEIHQGLTITNDMEIVNSSFISIDVGNVQEVTTVIVTDVCPENIIISPQMSDKEKIQRTKNFSENLVINNVVEESSEMKIELMQGNERDKIVAKECSLLQDDDSCIVSHAFVTRVETKEKIAEKVNGSKTSNMDGRNLMEFPDTNYGVETSDLLGLIIDPQDEEEYIGYVELVQMTEDANNILKLEDIYQGKQASKDDIGSHEIKSLRNSNESLITKKELTVPKENTKIVLNREEENSKNIGNEGQSNDELFQDYEIGFKGSLLENGALNKSTDKEYLNNESPLKENQSLTSLSIVEINMEISKKDSMNSKNGKQINENELLLSDKNARIENDEKILSRELSLDNGNGLPNIDDIISIQVSLKVMDKLRVTDNSPQLLQDSDNLNKEDIFQPQFDLNNDPNVRTLSIDIHISHQIHERNLLKSESNLEPTLEEITDGVFNLNERSLLDASLKSDNNLQKNDHKILSREELFEANKNVENLTSFCGNSQLYSNVLHDNSQDSNIHVHWSEKESPVRHQLNDDMDKFLLEKIVISNEHDLLPKTSKMDSNQEKNKQRCSSLPETDIFDNVKNSEKNKVETLTKGELLHNVLSVQEISPFELDLLESGANEQVLLSNTKGSDKKIALEQLLSYESIGEILKSEDGPPPVSDHTSFIDLDLKQPMDASESKEEWDTQNGDFIIFENETEESNIFSKEKEQDKENKDDNEATILFDEPINDEELKDESYQDELVKNEELSAEIGEILKVENYDEKKEATNPEKPQSFLNFDDKKIPFFKITSIDLATTSIPTIKLIFLAGAGSRQLLVYRQLENSTEDKLLINAIIDENGEVIINLIKETNEEYRIKDNEKMKEERFDNDNISQDKNENSMKKEQIFNNSVLDNIP